MKFSENVFKIGGINMNIERFDKIIIEQINRCTDVLVVKAKEYATDDRLHNFKVAGALLGISPKKALVGFMAKHIVSVYDMAMSDKDFSIEQWNEKITDSMNYLLLLRALIEEPSQK